MSVQYKFAIYIDDLSSIYQIIYQFIEELDRYFSQNDVRKVCLSKSK